MIEYFKRERKALTIITVVYFLSQWLILITTGSWWDEKTWMYVERSQMIETAMRLGKPSSYYLIEFMLLIPELCRRIVIFTIFLVDLFGVYYISKMVFLFDRSQAILFTMVFSSIPANDARIMWGVFPYSFGYFLFILAFSLLIIYITSDTRNVLNRILSLLCFGCSFILNSLLVFYIFPMVYLLVNLVKKHSIKELYKYFDFYLIPFVFFICKITFFPTSGEYSDYNAFSMSGILGSIMDNFLICLNVMKKIVYLWGRFWGVGLILGIIVTICVVMIYKKKWLMQLFLCPLSLRRSIFLLICGSFLLYISTFPYTVIGQGQSLTGVIGRGSILIGFGSACIFFSLISIVPNKFIRIGVLTIVAICGLCHYNFQYLLYQEDYYRQLDIICELKENCELLGDKRNILYISEDDPEIYATRFYTLNSLGYEAFGNKKRFFMVKNRDDYMLLDDYNTLNSMVANPNYLMDEYKYEIDGDNEIDAIICYNNKMSVMQIFHYKALEFFNNKSFYDEMSNNDNMQVITPDMIYFDNCLAELGIIE